MAYWKLHQLNEKLHSGKPRGNVSNSGTRGPLTTENLETTWTDGHVSPREKRHAQKLLGFLHLSCSAENCPALSIPHGILPSLFRRCVHQRLSIFQVDGFILAIGTQNSREFGDVQRPGSQPTRSANSTPIIPIPSNGENGAWLRIFVQNLSLSIWWNCHFSGAQLRNRSLKEPCSSPRPWVLDPNLPSVSSEWRPRTCQPPGRGWFIPSIFDEKLGITI